MTRLQRGALVFILVSAAALRLTGLNWDGFQHHHPDERYITWVATTIEFPSLRSSNWAAQWRPETSTFNPFRWPPGAASEGIVVLQDQPRDFAYGHVPLYLGVIATRLVERVAPLLIPHLPPGWSLTADVLNGAGRIEFHHLVAVGRALTALFEVGTVLFTFLLGRRLYGAAIGLMAAAMLAFTVLHIQLAHFFTSDPYLTFFAVAAIYFMVASQQAGQLSGRRGGAVYLALAGTMVGLAVGSKFSAVLLLLPLLWAAWVAGRRAHHPGRAAVFAVGMAVVVFTLTNPFAILDWTCPPLTEGGFLGRAGEALSRSCYAQNVMTQNAMVRGRIDLGFTRQFAGTVPYLYFFEMLLRWGMGPILGLLGLWGLVWTTWQVASARLGRSAEEIGDQLSENPIVTPLLWVLPYLILTGSFYVKFLRYMQPAVPFLLLFGAATIWQWREVTVRRAVATVALASGALYALAFVTIYSFEHPWNAASRWIHSNVPPGSLILSEQLDDYLPVTMEMNGALRRRTDYPNAELSWLSYPDAADDEAKLDENLRLLAEGDYLTILSNRVYGVIPRLPQRFSISGQYHQLLFDDRLGYELVWAGERSPRLLGWSWRADTFAWPGLRPPEDVSALLAQPGLTLGRADESFIVYDQPLTMIFRNTGRLSAAQMRAAFDLPGE